MGTVGPSLVCAEALQVCAAVVTAEMLDHAVRSHQACLRQQTLVRTGRRWLPDQIVASAAELHQTYIPAAQAGDRTSQNWGALRQAPVARKRFRCVPQASQVKFSTVPYGRVWRALGDNAACGMAVVGFPSKASQSWQTYIRLSTGDIKRGVETTNADIRLSRQFFPTVFALRRTS
jgi:hypothetical protein